MDKIKRIVERGYHLYERIIYEMKRFPTRLKTYGIEVSVVSFIDGLIPPGKSRKYIQTISSYVDGYIKKNKSNIFYQLKNDTQNDEKKIIWCCWWQGLDNMPEVVRMCHERLKQVIPADKAELILITLDNYQKYVALPQHILDKYQAGIITMTTMSDVLRFALLSRYGGYWLDATVFFTGDIPEEYFCKDFYCQKMENLPLAKREACEGKWCGFSMAGKKNNIVFQYMERAFSCWWKDYNSIIDYVLIDYLLLAGYHLNSEIKEVIDTVPNNNEDIFEMYKVLNEPYSEELYSSLTEKNVMHKLTYKMDLRKYTEEGQLTLYGYLLNWVYGN